MLACGFAFVLGIHPPKLAASDGGAPTIPHRVVAEYPHDVRDFTQGLDYHDGRLYESAGGYGTSRLAIKDLRSGAVLRERRLGPRYFAEGLTVLGERLLLLTWREGVGVVLGLDLREQRRFGLSTEGWGITQLPSTSGDRAVMSDGSAVLQVLDGERLEPIAQIRVSEDAKPVTRLNELEFVDGLIYANVWKSDRIALIRPDGRVAGWLDLSELKNRFEKPAGWVADEHVLNGIAFDSGSGHLLVTGKCWPKLFALELDSSAFPAPK